MQVADRWHLWHNLGEHLETEVVRHRGCLPEPVSNKQPEDDGHLDEILDATTDAYVAGHVLPRRNTERHRAVHDLQDQGRTMRQIARELHLSYNTVRKFARAAAPTDASWQTHPSILDPFKPHLHQRWNEAEHTIARLHAEIRQQGYRGSYATVYAYLRTLRGAGIVAAVTPVPPTPRKVTGWIMSRPQNLTEDDRQRLKAVLARCPELDAAASHVHDFADMLTGRHGERLPGWLAAVHADPLPSLHAFAHGIERDQPAVTTGLTLPWNSGRVEGHVNRIKMIKRQMFGRAGLPLLRKRVLLA